MKTTMVSPGVNRIYISSETPKFYRVGYGQNEIAPYYSKSLSDALDHFSGLSPCLGLQRGEVTRLLQVRIASCNSNSWNWNWLT